MTDCCDIYVYALGITVQANLLTDTANVLSLGLLCEKHGYAFHWLPYETPYLIKDGKQIVCKLTSNVPYCMSGHEIKVSTKEAIYDLEAPPMFSSTGATPDASFEEIAHRTLAELPTIQPTI